MNKKQSKEDLKNIHCNSFCNFVENEMREECKKACLCNTDIIEHKNSLEKSKCVSSSIPKAYMSEHIHNFSPFEAPKAPVVVNEPKAPVVVNEPKVPVVVNEPKVPVVVNEPKVPELPPGVSVQTPPASN